MITLSRAEFYITNHCNLNCEWCCRFNNFNFQGHYDLLKHADTYQRWSKKLNFENLHIMGGEPLMHPDIIDWIGAVRSWWPDVPLTIFSNGTLLSKIKNLYTTVRDNRAKIIISVHNHDWTTKMVDDLKDFYIGDYILNDLGEDNGSFTKRASDANGVVVDIRKYNTMFTPSLTFDHAGRAQLHNSDPKKSYSRCKVAFCHQFIDGKLYKCSVPPGLYEFNKQYPISLSKEDLALVNNPGGLTIDEFESDTVAGLKYLSNGPLDHCKFCPEQTEYISIRSTIGKTVFPIQQV